MIPPRRTENAVSGLRQLVCDTVQATRGDSRLDRIRVAFVGIERSPGVTNLLRDYTDAIFRNTERVLKDVQARAA